MCPTCVKFRPLSVGELPQTATPAPPWQGIGIHLFVSEGKDDADVVDHYFNFFKCKSLHKTMSKAAITMLIYAFTRSGIPLGVKYNNNPQFQAAQFQQFAS